MMIEMKKVRQIPGEGYRRWFTDENFDLFIWYDDSRNRIKGFQLSYDKLGDREHAITWREDSGFVHNRIDDGEGLASESRTPILVQDGLFDFSRVAEEFKEAAQDIEPAIRDFVYDKLNNYH